MNAYACPSGEAGVSRCPVSYSLAKSTLCGDVCSEHVWLGPPVAKAKRLGEALFALQVLLSS